MSRQLALDTIRLRSTKQIAHTEYSLGYHSEYIRKKTGMPDSEPGRMQRFHQLWSIDFLWGTNDGLHGNWGQRGRSTDMGHAVYAGDGSDQRESHASPFTTVEDVWDFDPGAEYGLLDFADQVAAYEQMVENRRAANSDQLSTGGYYKTIISGAIQAFGWEMLLTAAADRSKFEQVLERFYQFTKHHMNAWAQGAFMNPAIYRQCIIPLYNELWKPLKQAGKKVLFCSDGDYTEFAADVVAAGADGLIFEPCMDFGDMAKQFGQSTVLGVNSKSHRSDILYELILGFSCI